MRTHRWPGRALMQPGARRAARRALLLALVMLAVFVLALVSVSLRRMIADYAVSAARDDVVVRVNEIVKDVMSDERFGGGALVDLEHDADGNVSAVSANVAAINSLSAEVLSRAVEATEQGTAAVEIPLANILGSALFMNRGPSITVDVTVLSSSTASFRSEIASAGINQTRHQLFLDLDIQLSCMLPWREMDASVRPEILVSETVIVGQVPSSYMNLER